MNSPGKETNDWYSLQERALKLSDQAFKNLVGEYEEQIRNLKYEINSRDKKIQDLKSKLDITNKQVNTLKTEKNELCNLLDALETQNRSRDSKIEELCLEISEIKGEHELSLAKLERCLNKYRDVSFINQEFDRRRNDQLNLDKDDNRSLLSEQCENIEIKEIPNLLVSEAIHHPSNFITMNNGACLENCTEDVEGLLCSPQKIGSGNSPRNDISQYSVSKSGVWNRISQVLPKDSYFSLLNCVRQYHLGLMNEEELQTEIQNALLSNNEAVRNAFTKDILHLSSK
ncbi:uncharacterized protein cubi_01687 [Cryptosporidium ubiquitum]|uniref:Uncharacterized protein n=1 Tax=Cryptosporidium ubiquitum TaxID=857276 RepID=A0A1J4MEV1_9CRYT|nr:uncharacterized protein cubi_01687 [Cryptosporidium ubiquitum]OII72737.1 hypothetical protein cubi_01687 [Cryptosporidium ubiquitum]